MISATGVSKTYGDFAALDDVTVHVEPGSLTALLGPSGSGKSTLLRIIAGLEVPDGGAVTLGGEDVTGVPPQQRGIGFVFQHYAAFKHMTVRDNVAFGLTIRKRPKDEIATRVDELLGIVGLAGYQGSYPSQLSGRPAPADGARPRPRRRAEGASARRALRRARRDRPQGAAHLAAPPPRRGARDHDLRDPRPGGGDGHLRPDRGDERGPHRAGGLPARALRATPPTSS